MFCFFIYVLNKGEPEARPDDDGRAEAVRGPRIVYIYIYRERDI